MQESSTALVGVRAQWDALRAKRPSEFGFTTLGSTEVTAEDFEGLFRQWNETFETLSGRPKWLDPAQAAAWDRAISKRLGEINVFISQAGNNGVQWLFQATDFLIKVGEVSATLSVASKRQANVAKAVSQAFEKKGVAETQNVIEAGEIARTLLLDQPELSTAVEKLKASVAEEQGAVEVLRRVAADLDTLKTNVEQTSEAASSRRGQIEQLYTDADAIRLESERKADALAKKVAQLLADVEAASASATAAHASLDQALVDVRRQGLAGAFSERGGKVKGERRTWGYVFAGSILILAALAIFFAADLSKFTYEALTVALLRRAAMAAPLIWVGWYSAMQIARLSRIQEDYEYKAATALAFQSYRDEVEESGDNELKAELLRRAIITFGDNPVRLYGGEREEPVSPVSALIKAIKDDESLKLVGALRELMGNKS